MHGWPSSMFNCGDGKVEGGTSDYLELKKQKQSTLPQPCKYVGGIRQDLCRCNHCWCSMSSSTLAFCLIAFSLEVLWYTVCFSCTLQTHKAYTSVTDSVRRECDDFRESGAFTSLLHVWLNPTAITSFLRAPSCLSSIAYHRAFCSAVFSVPRNSSL